MNTITYTSIECSEESLFQVEEMISEWRIDCNVKWCTRSYDGGDGWRLPRWVRRVSLRQGRRTLSIRFERLVTKVYLDAGNAWAVEANGSDCVDHV